MRIDIAAGVILFGLGVSVSAEEHSRTEKKDLSIVLSEWHKADKGCRRKKKDACREREVLKVNLAQFNMCLEAGRWRKCSVDQLKRSYLRDDFVCRSQSRESLKGRTACQRRVLAANTLEKIGWCYGEESQINADYEWHRCKDGSVLSQNER